MDYETLEHLRRTLLGRRVSLLERRRQALADESELLADREPDWEDVASARTAASLIEGLSEQEREALARIDSTLDRMERGTYGICSVCRDAIDEDRLRAVPDTERCGRCAFAP